MSVCTEEHEPCLVFPQNSTVGTDLLLVFLGGITIQVKTGPSSKLFVLRLNYV